MFTRILVAYALVFMVVSCTSTSHLSEGDVEAPDLVDGCHTPLGFIPEGRSATGYLSQIAHGQNCQQGTLTCEDGVWYGAYIFPSCLRQ